MANLKDMTIEAKLDISNFEKDLKKLEKLTSKYSALMSNDFNGISGAINKLMNNDSSNKNYFSEIADLTSPSGSSGYTTSYKQAYDDLGGYLGTYKSNYEELLKIQMDYNQKRDAINYNGGLNESEKKEALDQLDLEKNAALADADLKTWVNYGHKVSGIFGNTFTSVLTGQQSFGSAMKGLSIQLGTQLLQILWQQAIQEILIEKTKMAAKAAIKGTGKLIGFAIGGPGGGQVGGEIFDLGGTLVSAIAHSGHNFVKYHSGGMNYSSYDVPGTAEQLALIKGGERVLSPAENVSYEQGNSNGSNMTLLNFNIKAWDGKDVIKTLRENASLIQQITANGIKNNQNSLRTIVQGV